MPDDVGRGLVPQNHLLVVRFALTAIAGRQDPGEENKDSLLLATGRCCKMGDVLFQKINVYNIFLSCPFIEVIFHECDPQILFLLICILLSLILFDLHLIIRPNLYLHCFQILF